MNIQQTLWNTLTLLAVSTLAGAITGALTGGLAASLTYRRVSKRRLALQYCPIQENQDERTPYSIL